MKLTLKHLAPYLPYKLKMSEQNLIYVLAGFNGNSMLLYEKGDPSMEIFDAEIIEQSVKPILRPLSDLTKEITVNWETFVPIEKIRHEYGIKLEYEVDCGIWHPTYRGRSENLFMGIYPIMERLFEWHFDVSNLIENELAIDINTLEK